MEEKLWRNKEWLAQKYWEEDSGLATMGKMAGCGAMTIRKWMIKYNIPRRPVGYHGTYKHSKETRCKMSRAVTAWHSARREKKRECENRGWLEREYSGNGRTSKEIAKMCGCDTHYVLGRLKYFGIPQRSRSERAKATWGIERRRQYSERMSHQWDEGAYDNVDWSVSDERRQEMSEIVKRLHREGVYDGVYQSPTSIEIDTSEALDFLGVDHTPQYRPEKCGYIYDEIVPPNILIEVNGDYWHSSPEAIDRDSKKALWAKQHGYYLITLWEHEIHAQGALSLVKERVCPLI